MAFCQNISSHVRGEKKKSAITKFSLFLIFLYNFLAFYFISFFSNTNIYIYIYIYIYEKENRFSFDSMQGFFEIFRNKQKFQHINEDKEIKKFQACLP